MLRHSRAARTKSGFLAFMTFQFAGVKESIRRVALAAN
jgi:hypothetical protein